MPIIIYAAGVEYTSAAFDGYIDTPEGKERKVLQVAADDSDPINDNGKTAPVSKNPAPFPARVAPTSSQPPASGPTPPAAPATPPMPTSDGPTSQPQIGPGTEDERNDSYVGGNQVDPVQLPNPEGGALAPNPDNSTAIPTGDQNPDSFDSDSAKPSVRTLSWFMGSRGLTLAATADEAAVAKWPLDFAQIEKDFARPNKPGNPAQEPQHVDTNDSEKVGQQEKPFETGLPL